MTKSKAKYPLIIAITGASGMIYAHRLIEILNRENFPMHLIITSTAIRIIQTELTTNQADFLLKKANATRHDSSHLESEIASGSHLTSGMVIIPASMGTIGRIASGTTENLVTRVADVHLKERRKLIIVSRETPLNRIHLENLLKLNDAGALIMPATPSFYSKPKTILDLVDTIIARILDHFQIEHNLNIRYSP